MKPEYQIWQALKLDGTRVTGYRMKGADSEVTLRDPATGDTTTISTDDIDELIPGSTLMPDGQMAAISRTQQRDLIRFLSELGKPGGMPPDDIDTALRQHQSHAPVSFAFDKAPLHPERWPNRSHARNKQRLYDFYPKQAEHFRTMKPAPMLLTEFPGLDGGQAGHWGYQTEQDWADDRWNQTLLGSMQAGVFTGNGKVIPRGVCVRISEQNEVAACFNPDTLNWEMVWKGGFVDYSATRHGFMDGIRMKGTVLPDSELAPSAAPAEKQPDARYRGFYRHGDRVIFSWSVNQPDTGLTEYLETAEYRNGVFTTIRGPAQTHECRDLIHGGPVRHPEVIKTAIVSGDQKPWAIDTIQLPVENLWKALFFCSGHDFLPDGSAMVCTMQGDVWHVSGLISTSEQPREAHWRRFASGLNHPLGLVISGSRIFVQCRDQLTELHDLNSDGEADFYECLCNDFETSPAGHDFICGLERDPEGNFYTASGNQGLLKMSPVTDPPATVSPRTNTQNRSEINASAADNIKGHRYSARVIATGFRNPDGLGILPDGTITVPCSEGEWTPASMICAVRPSLTGEEICSSGGPPFFGYRGPHVKVAADRVPEFPLAYLPRGLDNSSGGQIVVPDDRWGPLKGQLLHLSFGMGTHFLVLRDEVKGQLQGAVIPLPGDFRSGVHRGRFNPVDGQLYVTGMDGWVSFTPDDGCFQRVRYTGDRVQIPTGFHVHENGVIVRFAQKIDRSVAEAADSHFAQCWDYRYSAAYGSAELSAMHPGVRGHDVLTVRKAHLLPDEHSLFLEIPDIQPVSQLYLRMHVNAGSLSDAADLPKTDDGHDLFMTVNALDEPFRGIPSEIDEEKVVGVHPIVRDMNTNLVQVPNPWRASIPGERPIVIETEKNLTYQTRELRVLRSEPIQLTLKNPDVVPHNWALLKPESLRTVGEMANRMIADPEAVSRHYIPKSDLVLAWTDVVPSGESFAISFRAPETPGRYPFLCTFPGHWMVMNGVMIVE